jgi:hypothetical protein
VVLGCVTRGLRGVVVRGLWCWGCGVEVEKPKTKQKAKNNKNKGRKAAVFSSIR